MKKYKILSILLVFIILFSSIAVVAEDVETRKSAYNAGYDRGQSDAERLDFMLSNNEIRALYTGTYKEEFLNGYIDGFTAGKSTYGEKLGASLGAVHGEKDFKDKKDSDWLKSFQDTFPSDEKIIDMYNLGVETDEYRARFILEFTVAYEEAYIKAFEDANLKPVSNAADIGKSDGTSIGTTIGSFFGKKDAEENKNLDFLRHLPSDDMIVSNYNLLKDTKEYREAFITYFKIAFRESYEKSYRESNIGIINDTAIKDGRNKGFIDGKKTGEYYKGLNQLKPYNMVKPSDTQILSDYKEYLLDKNLIYMNDFLKGYHEGFKEGYESVISNESVYQDGYTKGYNDGKTLATKSNTDKTFIPYDKVKLDRNQAITNNYEVLKDKDPDYIILFIDGYLVGYEKGYKETIKAGEVIETPATISSGFGASFGMIYGEMAGIRDYQDGKSPNWSKAMPRDSEITSMFDLRNLPSIERNNFIDQFTTNFKIGYEKAYYNAHFGTKKSSMDAGRADGIVFGTMVGSVFGSKDFYEGRDADYNRNMPSERDITQEYSLNRDSEEYIKGFINGFKNAYQDAYLKSFREGKNNSILLEDSSAYENGFATGSAKGNIQSSMDHMEKKPNDWKRSQPLSSTIIMEYNLMYQTPKYRDTFINGFWDGYSNGYTETYKALSQSNAINKTTSVTVPISGAQTLSLDGALAVEIDKGIYYKPVILTIDTLNDLYSISNRYISASNFYRLSIINPNGQFAKNKKIKISFEYYGDKDGGIYKLEGNKWHYLTSTIEGNAISAYVNPDTINQLGNIFAVLVDKETEIFHDIRGHWAKDEVTAYIRRGVINGYPDKTFKPNQNIARAEFLVLLSRLYEWYLPYDISNLVFFKDYKTFGYSEKYLSYGLAHGYIIGYPDKYFRPSNNISYKEVDIIMKRVLRDDTFTWTNYAQKMMYEKKVRSSSYDSMDNKITRAEFSYMLYKLNEWKY